MSRNLCCCNKRPTPEAFCCNDKFFTDFITLYGDNMAQHAEVSPKDWIALYVERPGTAPAGWLLSPLVSTSETGFRCDCALRECGDTTNPCSCIIDDNEGFFVVDDDLSQEDAAQAAIRARQVCCTTFNMLTSSDGAKPVYFAYKYSGCHLIWYPREFSFNYDPHVAQCNGFLTKKSGNGNCCKFLF
jgi:hypothetical protein